jgi:hypothetical protein
VKDLFSRASGQQRAADQQQGECECVPAGREDLNDFPLFGLNNYSPFGLNDSPPFGLSLSKPVLPRAMPFDKLRANGITE